MNKGQNTSTTENLAKELAQRAVASIEAQLRVEIERNGFSLEKIKAGKQKLDRVVVRDEKDPRYAVETFAINKRAILAVKWFPNQFFMETNNETTAAAVKHNPKFGIKKNSSNLILSATEAEVKIEARAAQYLKNHLKVSRN